MSFNTVDGQLYVVCDGCSEHTVEKGQVRVGFVPNFGTDTRLTHYITPADARKLAAMLLVAAEKAEPSFDIDL
jgi:hypothetical protein